jgi:hypothetical protein
MIVENTDSPTSQQLLTHVIPPPKTFQKPSRSLRKCPRSICPPYQRSAQRLPHPINQGLYGRSRLEPKDQVRPASKTYIFRNPKLAAPQRQPYEHPIPLGAHYGQCLIRAKSTIDDRENADSVRGVRWGRRSDRKKESERAHAQIPYEVLVDVGWWPWCFTSHQPPDPFHLLLPTLVVDTNERGQARDAVSER